MKSSAPKAKHIEKPMQASQPQHPNFKMDPGEPDADDIPDHEVESGLRTLHEAARVKAHSGLMAKIKQRHAENGHVIRDPGEPDEDDAPARSTKDLRRKYDKMVSKKK